jgi:hypothetical protein
MNGMAGSQKMAKTRKSSKKETKRIGFRDVIMGCIAIIVVLLVLGLIVWLIIPLAGQKGVPRKNRWLQQSRLEPAGMAHTLRREREIAAPKFDEAFRQAFEAVTNTHVDGNSDRPEGAGDDRLRRIVC